MMSNIRNRHYFYQPAHITLHAGNFVWCQVVQQLLPLHF